MHEQKMRRSKRKAAEISKSNLLPSKKSTRLLVRKQNAESKDERAYGHDYGILPSD